MTWLKLPNLHAKLAPYCSSKLWSMSSTILANIGTLLKSMDKYGHVEPHISESFRDPYPKFNDLVPYCII